LAKYEPGEFSVWLWFPDGSYMFEAQHISAKDAVELSKRMSLRPAIATGIACERITITDGGDFTVFEWKPKEGVTFPERP
jgi:hypothetical protein